MSSVTGWQRAVRRAVDSYRALPQLGRAALFATVTVAFLLIAARAYIVDRVRDNQGTTPTAAAVGEPLDSVDALRQSYQATHDQFRRNIQLQVLFVLMGSLVPGQILHTAIDLLNGIVAGSIVSRLRAEAATGRAAVPSLREASAELASPK